LDLHKINNVLEYKTTGFISCLCFINNMLFSTFLPQYSTVITEKIRRKISRRNSISRKDSVQVFWHTVGLVRISPIDGFDLLFRQCTNFHCVGSNCAPQMEIPTGNWPPCAWQMADCCLKSSYFSSELLMIS